MNHRTNGSRRPRKKAGRLTFTFGRSEAGRGAGGKTTFRFKAVKSGETALKLIYHRAWEKDVEPAKTFYLEATVR